MPELLLEIGCEEIPAAFLQSAGEQLARSLEERLASSKIAFSGLSFYVAPRRLTVRIEELARRQNWSEQLEIGPPRQLAYDAGGRPTKAALAFAERWQVPVSKIEIVQTPRGEYLAVRRKLGGESTAKLLPALVASSIGSISLPRSMYWTEDKFRFVRPIRWLVLLYGGRVVRLEIAGVRSSNRTRGHRFLGSNSIAVKDFAGYRDALRRNFVIVDQAERREAIARGLAQAASQTGGRALLDQELLETVVNLNEYPSVIAGRFDREYLALPAEILITVMKAHQKYFAVTDQEGRLLPWFIAVINTEPNTEIVRGHERVLRARLADAKFFWEADAKQTLAERRHRLAQILFQEKLGSYADKTARLVELARAIGLSLGLSSSALADVETAASLAKVDLTTEMVKEFPELQGIVGGLYARREGLPETVARAIYDHYLPRNIEERSPETIEGAVVSLADKLDSVAGCFAVGLIPSGSRDPFAVRRQANGAVKILLDHALRLSLADLIRSAVEILASSLSFDREKTLAELADFFQGRVRYVLEQRGLAYDEINAALAVGWLSPYEALCRAEALRAMRGEDDFRALATAHKRIKNILRGQEPADELREDLLVEEAERHLYLTFNQVKPKVEAAVAELDYYGALKSLVSMREPVDRFFDKVLVMAEDHNLRRNRLALLAKISRLFSQPGDISEIVL